MSKGKNISAEEGYLRLYADILGVDKDQIFSTDPELSKDTRPELHPGGNLMDSIDHCLDEMSARNKRAVDVIRLLYGLDGNGTRTRRDIINELEWNVTTGRVGQVIDKGIRLLRNPTRKNYMLCGAEEFVKQIEETMHNAEKDINPSRINVMMINDPRQRYETISKFISDIVKTTSVIEFCNGADLTIRAYNCLKRSPLSRGAMMSDILLLDEEYDFNKIRNCGGKTAQEIKLEIAKWASKYIGVISYKDLRTILEPHILPNNMTLMEIVEKSKKMYLFNMPISDKAYAILVNAYECRSLYDIVTMFNDDNKFAKLCNDQPVYDIVMGIVDLYCSRLNTNIDMLQTAVKVDNSIRTEDEVLEYFCLTKSMREQLKAMEPFTSYTLNGVELGRVTNSLIYDRLKDFVAALEPSKMNTIVPDITYVTVSDPAQELPSICPYYNIYEIEQLIQIHRLFKLRALDISLSQAAFLWKEYSTRVHSDWVGKEDDDSAWLHIIMHVVINDEIFHTLKSV